MDEFDLRIRNHLYASFVRGGKAASVAEAAEALDLPDADVSDAYRRLHDAHVLVLQPDGTEIRMLNPFSAVETTYRVEAGGRSWFGNCAWDAFGIPAALGVDGHVSTSCLDCGEPIEIEIRGERPIPDEHVFHVAVPAAHWWDDIVFT